MSAKALCRIKIVGVIMSFAVCISSFTYALTSISRSSLEGCIRDQRTTQALRTIIARSSVSVTELHNKGQLSDELYARSREQNRLALASLPLPAC